MMDRLSGLKGETQCPVVSGKAETISHVSQNSLSFAKLLSAASHTNLITSLVPGLLLPEWQDLLVLLWPQ